MVFAPQSAWRLSRSLTTASRSLRERGAWPLVSTQTASFFSGVPLAPPDPILGLAHDFAADSSPEKINLAIGIYRDDNGQPYVLDCVKHAATMLKSDNMDYAPITGLPGFIESAQRICFGDDLLAFAGCRVASVQSLSGTGALRLAGDFLKLVNASCIHVPTPNYSNHRNIFRASGLEVKAYPYYNATSQTLVLDDMLTYFESLPENSVILLHACAHNPTGFDPAPGQWQVIVDVLESKRLIPLVDMAYQGFATGNLSLDGYLPRVLLQHRFPACFVAQSFAKNFGLYGQRTGALHLICNDADTRERTLSQLSAIIRGMYSSPPLYGAQLVDTIIRDDELRNLWLKELRVMAKRMDTMREELAAALTERDCRLPTQQLRKGLGMMALSGLSEAQVKELREKHHIYMTTNGRVAFSGLTSANISRVADAFCSVVA